MRPGRPVRTAATAALALLVAAAPASSEESREKPAAEEKKPWYESFRLRGYTQMRYSRLGETNERLVIPSDRSLGKGGGLLIRRARLVFSGDLGPVSFYLQPDFASSIDNQLHVGIVRDWYADIFLDPKKELRIRAGQSKVPYGFENLQSSQNRLPMDRADSLNSAVKDERDLGLFLYWAPEEIRRRFKHLVDSGLKGSGDYGAIGLGIFNGQGANARERNDTPHAVARVTWPFLLGSQFLEVGAAGMLGGFVVNKDTKTGGLKEVFDRRVSATVVLYPQPFGLQAEYNWGVGPQLVGSEIRERELHGGYLLASWRAGAFIPFVRGSLHEGARKFDKDAPRNRIREVEAGVEWQAHKALELTGAYYYAWRTLTEAPYPQVEGGTLRVQLQVNY